MHCCCMQRYSANCVRDPQACRGVPTLAEAGVVAGAPVLLRLAGVAAGSGAAGAAAGSGAAGAGGVSATTTVATAEVDGAVA